MSARTLSSTPAFTTTSEKDVYDRAVRQLPSDAFVLANIPVTDDTMDHEADLVALIPGAGIVVVEVKGSHCWHEDGQWWINRGGEPDRIDPFGQARGSTYALRSYVEKDPRWGSRRRVRWGHHVVLAHTPLEDDFAVPACPRWQISGTGDLVALGDRLRDTVELHKNDAAPPTREDVDLVVEILAGRSLPLRDAVRCAQDREEHAQRLTLEQATLLKVTRLLKRVEVRGGAGSGKTVMAVQQARDLAAGKLADDGHKQRVAMVCYSRGLASYLRRMLLTGSRSRRPRFVGTYEQLANAWGIQTTGDEPAAFWEEELPRLMAERAATLPETERFDAIIVDEAQDFAEGWWTPLVGALRDEEEGGLYVYSDERQRVFARFGRPPVALVPLVLDHNLRNTQQIARSFAPLAPRMQLRGADGPEVTFVACPTGEALGAADDAVDTLMDEGWRPVDIALVTVGKRHPVQVERQTELGQAGYWDTFWDEDDIFYGHVLGLKGLERRAVVLCVNIDADGERAAEKLYVGLSRATDRLVVVGDPAVVRAIGGDEVARRVGV